MLSRCPKKEFSCRSRRMKASTVQAVFWGFSAVMGLSLAYIFLIYTGASITRVFFITAGTFAGMSLYGYTTKRDLSGFGSFLMMGLIGIIIASVVNMFMQSSAFQFVIWVVTYIVPDLTGYNSSAFVANGFDIPIWGSVASLGIVAVRTLAFTLPTLLFGYFFLKSREIAK